MTTATAPAPVLDKAFSNIGRTAKQLRVNLADVHIDASANARKEYNDAELESLQASIEATGGIKTPIEIVAIKDMPETEHKKYALISGFRRCLCLIALSETVNPDFAKDVLALQIEASSNAGLKLSQLIENVQRADLNPLEVADGIYDAMNDESLKLKATDIARMTGLSQPKISQLIRMRTLPKSIQDMVRKNEITPSHARVISYDVPESRQEDMSKAARGMVFGDFEALVKKLFHSAPAPAGGENSGGTPATTGRQKSQQAVRATKLNNVYLPYFVEQRKVAEGAGDTTTAHDWQVRIDAVNWFLQNKDTDLGKATADFDKKIEENKAVEELTKKADTAEKDFIKQCIKDIHAMYMAVPTDPNAVRPTLAVCFAAEQQKVAAVLADETKKAVLGFTLESDKLDEFMTGLHKAYDENEKSKKEKAEKNRLLKIEKDKKAKEEAAKAKAVAAESDAAAGISTTVQPSEVDDSDMTDAELMSDSASREGAE